LLSPFAPHAAEEMWELLGHKETLAYEKWPEYNEEYLKDDEVEVLIQILGKPKTRIMMSPEASEIEMEKITLANSVIIEAIQGKFVRKVICVKGRLVNIVVG